MMTLKDRYIAAALEHVPDSQRDEVDEEIRTAVDEMVDQRIEAGEQADQATTQVLNELGDPAKLAASYQDRPRYFIGPGWFPTYTSWLKNILTFGLPVIVLVTLLTSIGVDGESVSEAIQDALESVILAAVQIVFWVTVGFFIAERVLGPDLPSQGSAQWTARDLPEAPVKRQITLGGILPEVIAMIVIGALALLQYVRGVGMFNWARSDSFDGIALVNPDLVWVWPVGFFALVGLSIATTISRYMTGFWTRRMMIFEWIDSALWSGFIVALAVSAPIINPAFAARVDEGATWWETGGQANAIIAIAVIAVSVDASWEAWKGHREYTRLEMAQV